MTQLTDAVTQYRERLGAVDRLRSTARADANRKRIVAVRGILPSLHAAAEEAHGSVSAFAEDLAADLGLAPSTVRNRLYDGESATVIDAAIERLT